MAPISTRVAFHSSIIHPPHHTWLWIVIVFFYSPSRNKVWKLSTVDNIPKKKKKKRRLRKRFRRNSKHGNTFERWQHWGHDPAMKLQTAYRPGAGEGFPNTQRGTLQRGAGPYCRALNQCLRIWHGQPSDPSSGVQGERWCRDWRQPSPSTGMTKTCAGRKYGLSW